MLAIDLKAHLAFATVSAPAANTSTVTGSAIDLRGYTADVIVQQQVGAVTGTTPTLDGKIQSSADGSTNWTDVTGATFTQVTASTSLQQTNVDTRAAARFIRYVGTIGGTTPSFTMAVQLIGQKATV
jgi:hypothetical protein